MKVEVRGIPVHYVEHGAGRPVILIHGLPTDHRYMVHHWEPVFAVRPERWRRIYPDFPGMGETPAADWITSQDDMLIVATEFIDAVCPGEQVSLVGASWGAYVVRGLARSMAERIDGVMLAEPMVHAGERALPPHRVLEAQPGIEEMIGPGEEVWSQVAVVQTAEALQAFRDAVKPGLLAADMAFLRRLSMAYTTDAEVERVEAPSLILTGRQDSATGYRDVWDIIEGYPRATFAVLDRAGHALAHEQRQLFRALTHEWLDRVAASSDA